MAFGQQIRESITNAYVRVPIEPIGMDARWTFEATWPTHGTDAHATAHSHIVQLGETTARWETDLVLDAPVTLLDRDVTLRKLSGQGHTNVTWASSGLAPMTDSRLAIEMRVETRRRSVASRLEIRTATLPLP